MPVWMTTTLVILVDRTVSSIAAFAETQRQGSTPFAPLMRLFRRLLVCRVMGGEPTDRFRRHAPGPAVVVA